ncbi:tripartite tricarboxylate transporter substrate binding protein [Alcaligenaceae bacterium LF4-65]|jgi:tripartite-type tricarboxylate transporter receptor subunit TctC|uniref:Tripartite tricarboxylate transporter substrate binding protein n=1 Tax=Zwartia hollandica TaxID=324606 RepID=A0A953NCH6_9BURK|nr:tripartite tricarboxylate transporter substrate binding protein [Zwartia hollandica]MBZ1350775.1 tripartite tricarboxylate transporter substrate binding protein [Zwartia hollandica]
MRLIKTMLAAAITLSAIGTTAHAEYPDKPIKMLVGYAPGGAADKLIRPITDRLSKILKQPIVIDYKPGAGASLAADLTSKAPADGYTLHITDSGPMTILPHMRKLGYDPLTSFTPISMVGGGGVVVVVLPTSKATDIKTLVELAKKDPKNWSYGTSGIGGVGHLAGEQFKAAAKLDIAHIPYKGGNPALAELLGGHVPVLFSSLGAAATQIQSGKLRALADTSSKRSSMFPDVPTMAEAGFPGFDATIWFGIVGPAGLPKEVMNKLVPALASIMKDPEVIAAIKREGYEPMPFTPQQTADRIKSDFALWGKTVKDSNIKAD